MAIYKMPPISEPVADLVPESADGNQLTPATPVLVLHRGRTPLVDKFDGRDYVIHPGKTIMPYGAARHFQDRAVVPGTRNPEVNSQQSYLAILGHDDPAHCEPLTDEDVERSSRAIEAIDRGELSDPADRDVKVIAGGRVTKGRKGGKKLDVQASSDEVFEKPETTDAQEDEKAAKKSGRT